MKDGFSWEKGTIRKVIGESFVISSMKRRWMIWGVALTVGALAVGITRAWAAPVEVGEVDWGRDYEAALAKAKESGKPVLILFQEVPG